jgi:hypothetical protein
MRSIRRWAGWVGASAVLIASLGCGNDRVSVYRVHGKVTLDGKPMRGGGAISFMPAGGQAGKAAGGEIAEDGSYELTTYSPGDGSMAGEFRVVINQVVEKEPEMTQDGQKAAKAATVVPPADRIPDIYSDPVRTPLTAKVEAKSPNEINLDLKRSAAEPPPGQRGAMGKVQPREVASLR